MMIPATQNNINIAKQALLNGDPIIYPTDTLYSFGAIATDSKAINKINAIKKRISPLSIIVGNSDEINIYGNLKRKYIDIVNNILPGKYTILLKAKKHKLSRLIQNDSDLIGIRLPKHYFSLKLVNSLLTPIITTSVNIHGQTPLINLDDIKKAFPEIKIFYDKRTLDSKGSTILDLSGDSISVIRKGDAKIVK